MKNVTPVSDQDIDVDGPARDDHTPALSQGGPVVPLGTDPAWDLARRLLKVGRSNARALAEEIERLRMEYLRAGQGRRTDRQPSAQIVPKVHNGFQAKLREELGLHHEQAKRLQDAAAYEMRIEAVALAQPGEVITWIDPKGGSGSMVATPEKIEVARNTLQAMGLPGGPRPPAAWAGVSTAAATRGKERAPVDHLHVWRRACKSLSAGNYAALIGKQRIVAIEDLVKALSQLPDEVRDEIVRGLSA